MQCAYTAKTKNFTFQKTDFEAILEQARIDADRPAAVREVLLDRRVDIFEVNVSKLSADQLMQFIFRGDVHAYANRLGKDEFRIGNVPVYLPGAEYVSSQKQPFVRALWLRGTCDSGGDLVLGDRARGVRKFVPAGAAPNPYQVVAERFNYKSPQELKQALKIIDTFRRLMH